jgi:23S rRNA (uracil1939-C5)-methyltransferase
MKKILISFLSVIIWTNHLDFGPEVVNSQIMNQESQKSEPRCPLQDQCSGCDRLHLSLSEQKSTKLQEFQEKFSDLKTPPLEYHSFGDGALRSRLDFVLMESKIGLYQKDSREIVDIETCLQLEPALQDFYSKFRKIPWPIKKGSVRLRVSPTGECGAWLDFANEDIKRLLEAEESLLRLQELAVVEIGQKHKSLIRKSTGTLGLGDPIFKPWFETSMNEKNIPLFSTVASFTQPSHIANKMITQTLSQWFQEIKPDHVLEFGSGIGNLTFPALSAANTHVTATDVDEIALEGLKLSLKQAQLQSRVTIQRGDFRVIKPNIQNVDVLLLNPARSGVGKFLEHLLPLKPKHIIYMSCYPESFLKDIQILKDYSINKIHLIDQFPNTKHIELLSHLLTYQ